MSLKKRKNPRKIQIEMTERGKKRVAGKYPGGKKCTEKCTEKCKAGKGRVADQSRAAFTTGQLHYVT